MSQMESDKKSFAAEATQEFKELFRYSIFGYLSGLLLGVLFDSLGYSRSGVGQWLVRTLSGEGESIFEGLFAIRKKLSGATASLAQAYGFGKLIGMIVPWIVDGVSRLAGLDVYGIEGFYIPFFYAMADQMGASVSGFLYFKRESKSAKEAALRYITNPVMLTGLIIILLVPTGLFSARLLGFSPSTQLLTSLETILSNLCWIPPFVGWMFERRAT